jgi:hypothetical protein
MEFQSYFDTTFSPAHLGEQNRLHTDVHFHLSGNNGLWESKQFQEQNQYNHVPLYGQTTINDFSLRHIPGCLDPYKPLPFQNSSMNSPFSSCTNLDYLNPFGMP